MTDANSNSQQKSLVESKNDLAGQFVLVVDDMPDNRLLLGHYLKALQLKVVMCESGEEALQAATQETPDLILMDIQMPGIDGYEATRRLRQMGHRQPIIALTAHTGKEEYDRCLQAGCDTVLTKPVSRQILVDQIKKYLIGGRESTATI